MTDEELIAHLRLQGLDKDIAAADRIEQLVMDRKFILNERDRTFALMLTRTETAEAKLAKAVEALLECQEVIDKYSRQEYPADHPVHERYRKRDYDANPARIALAELEKTE